MAHTATSSQQVVTPSVACCVLDCSIPKVLDYRIPLEFRKTLRTGMRVRIPLRGRSVFGFVIRLQTQSSFPKLSAIEEVVSGEEILSSDIIQLAEWIQKYYLCSYSQAIRLMIPAPIRKGMAEAKERFVGLSLPLPTSLSPHAVRQQQVIDFLQARPSATPIREVIEATGCSMATVGSLIKKGFLFMQEGSKHRSSLPDAEFIPAKKKEANEQQKQAITSIVSSLDQKVFAPHLLFGVTGSGKTEVYLQAIEAALAQGLQALVLIPEIALTEQTIDRFRRRFANKSIAVLHHKLASGQKRDEWFRMLKGEVDIAIGARSAIFAPLPKLGILIVDEEHEPSYKSESQPCYHARDVALVRGKMLNIPVILGSATPSLESYQNAKKGKYHLHHLTKRALDQSLPKVTLVDMRKEWEKRRFIFSDQLLNALKVRLEKGEQSILFLNRRGFHTSQICQDCGTIFECPHCATSLTYHKQQGELTCHLCHYHCPPHRSCPSCKGRTLQYKGCGTEKIEEQLKRILPDAQTLRLDADTTAKKGSLESKLLQFRTHKADILIGTQMVAKGLDFPFVTLVGILQADNALMIPDFRASERSFQLLTQVAGRSGRAKLPGEVILQTLLPDQPTIQFAKEQDYEGFFQEESKTREIFQYPPFNRMAKILFSGKNLSAVRNLAQAVYQDLKQQLPEGHRLHPPHPSGYQKIKETFRYQILLRAPSLNPSRSYLHSLLAKQKQGIRITIDIDPLSTFF